MEINQNDLLNKINESNKNKSETHISNLTKKLQEIMKEKNQQHKL